MKTISRKLLADSMLMADMLVIVMSCMTSFYFYLLVLMRADTPHGSYLAVGCCAALIYGLLASGLDSYRQDRLADIGHTMLQSLKALLLMFVLCLLIAFVTKTSGDWSRGWAIAWLISAASCLIALRLALLVTIGRWHRKGYWHDRIIIVGSPRQRERVTQEIGAERDRDIEIVGSFDDRRLLQEPMPASPGASGDLEDLIALTRSQQINCIVLAMSWSDEERILRLNEKLSVLPIDIHIAFPTRSLHQEFLGFTNMYGMSFIRIGNRPLTDRQVLIKRIEDLVLGSLAMLVAAPVMLFVALLIRLDSPGPILFRQPRHGFNDTIFTIYKFRTMHVELGDPKGAKSTLRNDPRVTRIGKILRRWSIDELPQLLNVLTGDMSLVGPRAHPVEMYAEGTNYRVIAENYAARHRVKPGITGWAQVKGNRGLVDTVEKARERIDLDMEYISNWSLKLDAYILLLTAGVLLTGEEAY